VVFDKAHLATAAGARPYDVAPDGRFVTITPGPGGAADEVPSIVLVQNFFDELRRLAPTD
jgi:hypothetical protein